jgi:D-alanine-D-alanine ligase
VKLLEVNPNPGWCWDGKLNLMAGFAGIPYSKLLGMVLEAATERLALQRGAMEKAPEPGQAAQPAGQAAVADTLSL